MIYVIRVVAMPRVDAIKALRKGLKFLKRACGLRAISVAEENSEIPAPPQDLVPVEKYPAKGE